MRIAFFVRCMSNGGAERVAARLTQIWRQLGHETIVFTELQRDNFEFEHECIAREQLDFSDINESSARQLQKKYSFQVAVFNDAINADWFEMVFRAVKALKGVKVIVINHHTANNWMYGTGNTRELFMDELLRKADAFVCVDRIWALWWKYRGVRATFIPNPVAYEKTSNEMGGVTLVSTVAEAAAKLNGKVRILWIGRIGDGLKRASLAVDVFVKAFSAAESGATRLPTMIMLGTKNVDVERSLRRRIARVNPRALAYLIMPGFVTDIKKMFQSADVHLFTSVTEVTVPQVVREAQMLGVDTVAFDQPFMRCADELLEDGLVLQKWCSLFCGQDIISDFEDCITYHNLMDELANSQQYFARVHLPIILKWRRFMAYLNVRHISKRLFSKILRRG